MTGHGVNERSDSKGTSSHQDWRDTACAAPHGAFTGLTFTETIVSVFWMGKLRLQVQ